MWANHQGLVEVTPGCGHTPNPWYPLSLPSRKSFSGHLASSLYLLNSLADLLCPPWGKESTFYNLISVPGSPTWAWIFCHPLALGEPCPLTQPLTIRWNDAHPMLKLVCDKQLRHLGSCQCCYSRGLKTNRLDYCSKLACGWRCTCFKAIDARPKYWAGIGFFEMGSFLLLIPITILRRTYSLFNFWLGLIMKFLAPPPSST